MTDETSPSQSEETPEFSKVVIGLIVAILVISGIVYAGYSYSQRQAGKTTLPNGYPGNQNNPPQTTGEIDCAKPRGQNVNVWDYYTKCDQYSVAADAKWVVYTDPVYKFTFNLPEGMPYQAFTNGLGLAYKEFDPKTNLIYSLDLAAGRQSEFKTMTGKNYVENYWKQWPGLTGISNLEDIVNGGGVKGWKAVYLLGNKPGNTEMFFELTPESGNFVHFTKGIMSQPVFDNVIGTFKLAGQTAVIPTVPATTTINP